MEEIPETRYTQTRDGAYIAFQVFGTGDIDVLLMPGYFTNIDENWRLRQIADVLHRIGEFARVIVMDRRGLGLSDRMMPGQVAPLETHVDDLVAVLDAAHAHDVCLITSESGGPMLAILFAAAHPERVRAIAMYGPISSPTLTAISGVDPSDPANSRPDMSSWGDVFARRDLEICAPSYAADPTIMRAYGAYLRAAASPGSALALFDQWAEVDARDLLGSVQAPTLVLIRPDAPHSEWSQTFAEELVSRIPNARLVPLAGRDLPWWLGDREALVAELQEFFTGTRSTAASDHQRVLATVLFTDIVDSTARSAAVGDGAWQEVRQSHDAIVRANLDRFRGREVKTMGDGFLATFDGPARGIGCATTIAVDVRPLGIEIRAGLHTGEIAFEGDDIAGIGVAIGARVGAKAAASEVLVSQTVKDLVVGSGLTFEDAGEHELKGVPDRWRLYRVLMAASGA
jgi:class 3 adenylate cyclase